MGQENTFSSATGPSSQTRTPRAGAPRSSKSGGFREQLRAAEDADLTFRLQNAGWEVERREDARGTHRSRQTARAFAVQKLHHGAGAAWLDREYPGSFPARRRPGLIWWGVRTAAKGLAHAVRRRDRDAALWAVFEPLELISREFGRSMNNERLAEALMPRPTVDVVVPFRGPQAELDAVAARLPAIELGEGDTLVVVDNHPGVPRRASVPLMNRADRLTPAFARNRGAAEGEAEWLLFLRRRRGGPARPAGPLLRAGAGRAHRAAERGAGRRARPARRPAGRPLRAPARVHEPGATRCAIRAWGFPKTANLACRRAAFEEVGGFREDIRGGEDADLTFRLRAAGLGAGAARGRRRWCTPAGPPCADSCAQKLVHGPGRAWVAREYPGPAPRRRFPA